MNWIQSLSRPVKYVLPSVCLVFGAWVFFSIYLSEPPPLHPVRFAVPGFQSSALVILAEDQGFFADEGIEASLEFKATGRDCLDLVIKQLADYAVVFETPVVHATLAGHGLSILTEMHRSDSNTAVVVRRDRGINLATDLIGKTIAVVPKTNAEYLLDLYLRSHLIDLSAVNLVKMSIGQAVEDLSSGKIDGAALWEPYVGQAMAKDRALFNRLQSSYYSEFSVLVGLQASKRSMDKTSFAVLRGLLRANEFFQEEGPRAHKIVENKLRSLGFFVSEETWETLDINIGLSATLLTMLNEEAHWYRSRNGLTERQDMQHLLESRYVKAVASEQVTYE